MAGLIVLTPRAASAQDTDAGPNAHHEAARIIAAELAMEAASDQLTALAAEQPSSLADTMRHELAVAAAQYAFRQAVRVQQRQVYDLAGYADVESSVIALLPAELRAPIQDSISALHSLYILGGIDQYYLVNPHYTLPYANAAPLGLLRSFYVEAQLKYGVDASYLAAINFIESKYGRVNGPSSAGAVGPMQFLPSTWTEYGQGGNINDPHDAILAAARYLQHNGAPYNMSNAIWHYNNSYDYVDSVQSFARAFRSDPGWLDRMYYWDTAG
jgi:soluble lytic murein transglycosylase-like protein